MLDDIIRFQAGFRPDAAAIIGKRGRRTFARFEADIRRAVHELAELTVEPGEAVSIAVEDIYLEWVLILALARLGIASSARWDDAAEHRITDRAGEPGDRILVLTSERIERIENGPEQAHFRVAPDPEALGHVFKTSGTTGDPKRVGLSWGAMWANIQQISLTNPAVGGPWLITTGTHTQLGFNYSLGAWFAGKSSVEGVGPSAELIFQLKPRLLGMVPVQLQYLLDALPPGHRKWPVRIVSGGSSLPPALARRIRTELSADVILNYACTEVSQIATATLDVIERNPGAAGYPRPNVEIRVVDEEGRDVAPGEVGRLCFRTGRLSMGYLDDPELTAESYRDGWFRSRDLGRLRSDGLLLLEGRVDDLMNLGGHKVPPVWIEEAALRCRGIADAGAFPFRTESGLDSCGLAVVTDGSFELAALERELYGRLMPSQHVHVVRCPHIPRNDMGKIDRARLRDVARKMVGV